MNPFQKKRKLPEYKFQNSPEGDSTWVEITSGEYSGVVYSYGMVKFDESVGVPHLKFDFTILHSGDRDIEDLQNDQEYVTIMGDILTDIIINNEPTRTNNPQESDL